MLLFVLLIFKNRSQTIDQIPDDLLLGGNEAEAALQDTLAALLQHLSVAQHLSVRGVSRLPASNL